MVFCSAFLLRKLGVYCILVFLANLPSQYLSQEKIICSSWKTTSASRRSYLHPKPLTPKVQDTNATLESRCQSILPILIDYIINILSQMTVRRQCLPDHFPSKDFYTILRYSSVLGGTQKSLSLDMTWNKKFLNWFKLC